MPPIDRALLSPAVSNRGQTMKIAALIGYPLAHSVTPAMYAPAFHAMGIEVTCEKWVTPPEALPDAVARLREPSILGANVTVPHKETVIPLLDDIEPSAGRIGAVNCIVRGSEGRLTGHNTDKYGFLRSLREAGFEARGHRVMVLGAGGAARAVVAGLLEAGAAAVTVANRTAPRAKSLSAVMSTPQLRVATVGWEDTGFEIAAADADLIVNTTPMGTAHTDIALDSPIEARHFHPGAFAYDLVYNPTETPFLRLARAAGAVPVSGLEMLVYQGAESIRLYTGLEPPVDIMRAAAVAAIEMRATPTGGS